MYEINQLYKINVQVDDCFNKMFTGIVEEEDALSIKIFTIKNETVILKKENIIKAVSVENGARN